MASKIQLEIQGLRAVAVLLVLFFHIWPSVLSGGYIGVDVFFVISGFLITRLMLKELEQTGRLHLGRFYSRRIRRLAPAATAVLIVVLLGYQLYPVIFWGPILDEAVASVFYYQNWYLARQAVDYLAAGNAPGPLQHFWSLTVEEQYYLFWPLICLVVGFTFGPLHRSARSIFAWLIISIGMASLIYSWYLTSEDPGAAYFSTFTRAWELALGGGLAVFSGWTRLSSEFRRLMGFIGIILIIGSATSFTKSTPFPGVSALLPTIGAALIIVSGSSSRKLSTYFLLKSQPFQYVGSISYSLYLWHWPIVILYTTNVSTEIGLSHGVLILSICIALAHFSKEKIEDVFQIPSDSRHYIQRSLLLAIMLAVTTIVLVKVNADQVKELSHLSRNLSTSSNSSLSEDLKYQLLSIRDDKPDAYAKGCYGNQKIERPKLCVYGDTVSRKKVLLIGDSHAAQWLPALRVVAEEQGWQLTLIAKSACAFSDVPVNNSRGEKYSSCEKWNELLMGVIKSIGPEYIFFSQSRTHKAYGAADRQASSNLLAESIGRKWLSLQASGVKIFYISDTPWMGRDIPECLAANIGTPSACDMPRKKVAEIAGRTPPMLMAAEQNKEVEILDFTSEVCDRETCFSVVNGHVIWRDGHHLTASFVRSLSGAFSNQLRPERLRFDDRSTDPNALDEKVIKQAEFASKDVPRYGRCYSKKGSADVKHCKLSERGETSIALVGDSRLVQWVPGFESLSKRDYKLLLFAKWGCPIGLLPSDSVKNGDGACDLWHSGLSKELSKLEPSLVIISQSVGYRVEGMQSRTESSELLSDRLKKFSRLIGSWGGRLIVIPDTPRRSIDVSSCVKTNPHYFSLTCSENLSAIQNPEMTDPLLLAGLEPDIGVIDMTDRICKDGICTVLNDDDIFIWRSRYLITKSFALSNSEYLKGQVMKYADEVL